METKNVTISKEYLEKIRRFTAIRPEETFAYVPIAFRELPDELKPKFTLRPISGEDALRYADDMRGEVTIDNGKALVSVKRGAYAIAVVKKGLVAWSNYYDVDNDGLIVIVPFTHGVISGLPMNIVEELADAIASKSNLTEEEVLGLK